MQPPSDLSPAAAAAAAVATQLQLQMPPTAAPSPTVIWAMLCAAAGFPIPSASIGATGTGSGGGGGGGSSDDPQMLSTVALPFGLPDVRYLPLMPLPRAASASSSFGSGRRRRGQARSRTNSERGKEFRARQRQHELELLTQLTALQSEVDRLQATRDMRRACALQTRRSDSGSLVRLVRQYHELFFMGAPEAIVDSSDSLSLSLSSESEGDRYADLISRQHNFLRYAIDPDLMLGEERGVGALMENWKRYTRYHHNLRMQADTFKVSGSTDKPIITVAGTMRARYTRETMQNVFPHAIHNEALVQRFLGREVVYKYRNIYEFSDDGRIVTYIPEVEFVQALLDAGGTIEDVAILMQEAQIASQYILGPTDEDGYDDGYDDAHTPSTIDMLDDDGSDASSSGVSPPSPVATQGNPKLQLTFLLSAGCEDDEEYGDVEF